MGRGCAGITDCFFNRKYERIFISDDIRRAYLHVVSKEISGANFKDISDEEPAIIDGVCSSLVYLRDEIDRAGGETVIVLIQINLLLLHYISWM